MATIKKGTYRFKDTLTIPLWLTDRKYISIGFTTPALCNTDEGGTIIPWEGTDVYNRIILLYTDAGFTVIHNNSENLANIHCYTEEKAWNAFAYTYEQLGYTNYELANGYGQTITVTADTDVDDTFASWFEANTTQVTDSTPAVEITYKDTVITLNAGQTARLHNADGSAFGFEEDLVIKANEVSSGGSGDIPVFDGTIEIGGKPATDYIDYYEKGKTEGITEGRQAEYNAFWDAAFSTIGSADSIYAKFTFAGAAWNDTTFSPNKSLSVYQSEGFFREARIVDLKGILERNSVAFDFSNVINCDFFGYSSKIKYYPKLNFAKASRFTYTFGYSNCESIPLTLADSGSQPFDSAFVSCSNLVDLIIEGGVIGQNGFNVQWSTKLSKASWESIVTHLSGTTSGLSVTGSLESVNTAFETSAGAKDGSTSTEWLNLIATKQNWTINLV